MKMGRWSGNTIKIKNVNYASSMECEKRVPTSGTFYIGRLTFKPEFEKSHFFDDLDDIFYG